MTRTPKKGAKEARKMVISMKKKDGVRKMDGMIMLKKRKTMTQVVGVEGTRAPTLWSR